MMKPMRRRSACAGGYAPSPRAGSPALPSTVIATFSSARASPSSGCRLLEDPVIAELDGERVLLTHGDALCTDDHAYQELRTLVRTPQWQQRFLALPRAHRELLAEEARAGSRRHTARTVPDIMDVNPQAVAAAFRATRVRRMIHGHTHRPGVHRLEIDGAPAERIVLGAWYEEGSYLSCERGRFELRALPR